MILSILMYSGMSLELPLVIAECNRYSPTPTSDPFVLVLADSGHVAGASAEIFLSGFSGIIVPSNGNFTGEILTEDGVVQNFDSNFSYVLFCQVLDDGYTVVGTIRRTAERDMAIPAIDSAIIRATNLDQLEVNFSAPMWLPNNTGISINDSPTGKTLGSVVSSSIGSKTLYWELSGDVVVSDTVSLIINSNRLLQSLNGKKIAADTYPITIAGRPFNTMTNCILDCWTLSDAEITQSSGVTSWIDRSSSAATFSGTISAGKPTWIADTGDGTGAIQMNDASNIQALQATNPITITSDFSLLYLVKCTSSSGARANYPFSLGSTSTGTWIRQIQAFGYSLGGYDVDGSHPDISGGNDITFADNTWEMMHFYRHGTKWGLTNIRTGANVEATIESGHPTASLNKLTLGSWFTNNVFFLSSFIQIKAIAAFSAFQDSSHVTTLRGLWQDAFTDCP